MAKLKMSRIELIAPLSDSRGIVDLLQRRSVVEICKTELPGFTNLDTSVAESQLEKYKQCAEDALKLLDRYVPVKKGLADMLSERKSLTLAEYIEKSSDSDKTLGTCRAVIAAGKTIAEAETEIVRARTSLDILAPWLGCDIPTDYQSAGVLSFFIGTLPKQYTADEVLSLLASLAPEASEVDCEVVSSEKALTRVIVYCHKSERGQIDEALRTIGFTRPQDPTKHPPAVRQKRLTERIEALNTEIDDAKDKLKQLSEKKESIEFLIDWFAIRLDKYDAIESLAMSDHVFVVTGYCAEKYALSLKKEIEDKYVADFTVLEPPEDDDNVPVVLENGSFSRPAESIVRMYSVPSKNDIDPTALTAFFYYVFFGAMLSDAGYGLLMVIGLSVILKKFRLEPKMRDTLRMYRYCGISTMVWGALYGSWFGDIINVVRTQFMGLPATRLYLWLDPLNDLMRLMVWCFGFGLVHLFVGVGAKAYMQWREGKKFDAIADSVPVYVLILGVAPIFVGLFLDVPAALTKLAPFVAGAGAVLVIAATGRSSKSIGGKIGKGLYELYNTLAGYLGDVLSYSRLLALGLATGVIASVVNLLGTIPQNTVVKAIVLVPVFIVGHIANLGINIIGAYVHALRLQYVEFYAKFFEGGGRELNPLRIQTKFFKFKEEA